MWIARKQVIAWGIINELSVEIERLEAITVGDCDELQALKATLERVKHEHACTLSSTTDKLKVESTVQLNAAREELEQLRADYERRIAELEAESEEKLSRVNDELSDTRAELASE